MKRRVTQFKRNHKRTILDFQHSQTGEVQFDNAAGRDIYSGVPPDVIVMLLREDIADERHARRLVVTAIEMVDNRVERSKAELSRELVFIGYLIVTILVAAIFILGIVVVTK